MTGPSFWWTAIASAIVFVASLIAVPWVIVRLPADYFNHRRRVAGVPQQRAIFHYLLIVLKNIVGVALLGAGVSMLVLPGQGLLTILIGVSLINFPGKYRLERYLVSRGWILAPLNWIRGRAGKPDFRVHTDNS